MNQIHSNKVEFIDDINKNLSECDAIITDISKIALVALVADCLPVLMIDYKNEICAAIHSGRKGIELKICTQTFLKMNSKACDIKVFVGPSIKFSCYEVGNLDIGKLNKFKIDGKFDMHLALKNELNKLGIYEIYFSDICNHCDKKYFSYRRESIESGRFSGFVIKK